MAKRKPQKSTIYRGVSFSSRANRWRAKVTKDGQEHHIGHFSSDLDAARAYDRAALALFGERAALNFPGDPRVVGASPAEIQNKWGAMVTTRGRPHSLGAFESEEEAARARDRAALAVYGPDTPLNFPLEDVAPTSIEEVRREARRAFKSTTTSRYRGVHWAHHCQAWLATIRKAGVGYALGHFDDEEEAARAYDRAARRLHGKKAVLNFP